MLCRVANTLASIRSANSLKTAAFLHTCCIKRHPTETTEDEEGSLSAEAENGTAIAGDDTVEAVGFAFNHMEKKKGLVKPSHTIAEQIDYMHSKAYKSAYKGLPVYHWYRRNFKGQALLQPPPRLRCLDNHYKFKTNNPCPICRDEYLFFDYRNPELIMQFLKSGTAEPLHILKSGLCFEQYHQLQVQLLKAKEHGTIKFCVPFRNFDYKLWYPWWDGPEHVNVCRGSSLETLHKFYPDPVVLFPTHNRDRGNNWDQWWIRHQKFAQRGK